MKRSLIMLMFALVFLFAGQTFASSGMAVVSDTTDNGEVETGSPFLIDIYFENDYGEMLGVSIPFRIYSPDGSISAVTHVSFQDSITAGWAVFSIDGGNDSSIVMYNGWNTKWSMFTAWTGNSWNGTLPDTINFTGIALSGWTVSAITKYLGFALQSDETGQLCIDSIAHASATYDWLFDDPDVKFNGPYCWTVVIPQDVKQVKNNMLPVNFALDQNYPNPFNPTTIIGYALPKRSDVTITIYNVLGQKVKTLVNEEFEAGYYQTEWNSTDDNGGTVASGIYFYRIDTNNFTDTKKLMLIK